MAESPYLSQFSPNIAGPSPQRGTPMRPVSGLENLDEVAAGLGRIQAAMVSRQEEEGRAWAAEALSRTKLDWATRLAQSKEQAQPGAPDFTPQFLKEYDEYSAKAIENAPQAAKRFMRERLTEYRNSLGSSAIEFEAQARIDHRTDQFTGAMDNVSKLMNIDPGQYRTALDEQLAIIRASNLPPVKKSAMEEKLITKVSEAAAWTIMRNNPVEFLEKVGVTGGKSAGGKGLRGVTGIEAFDALSFDNRVKLVGQALTLKAQQDADADKRLAAMRKDLEETVLKDLYAKHADGKLTRSLLDQNKDYIGASEYKSLLKMLKGEGGGGGSDHNTVRDLVRLMYDDPKEAVKKAFQYHASGLIKDSFLSSVVTTSRSWDRQEGPKSQYELSRKYVVDALDPGPFVQDPIGRRRMAEATALFDAWYRSGKFDDAQVEKRGREIVQQFSITNSAMRLQTLPQPRFGTPISRNATDAARVQADIARNVQDLQKRLSSKQITESDYQIEMSNLKAWKNAVETK